MWYRKVTLHHLVIFNSTAIAARTREVYSKTNKAIENVSMSTDFKVELMRTRSHSDSRSVEWYSRVMRELTANVTDGVRGTWRHGSAMMNFDLYRSLLLAYDASGAYHYRTF